MSEGEITRLIGFIVAGFIAGRGAREPDPDAAGGDHRQVATRLVLTVAASFPLRTSAPAAEAR